MSSVVFAVVVGAMGYWWWRSPRHGGVVVITGRLPEPYVLDGGIFLKVSRRDPDCTAFKVQNPIPRSDSFGVEFERRGRDQYRARIDLREASIGGFCEWQIRRLAVGVYPPGVLSRGETVARLETPIERVPGDQRPRWNAGPMQVHCTRTGDTLKCSDAVDAIQEIEPEGHYELNIEIEDTPPDGGT